MSKLKRPLCISACADCGIGTHGLGEWYMAREDVWEEAWAGRRKVFHGKVPGQEILCIACLEKRIGRRLTFADFTDVPINNPADQNKSKRLRHRLRSGLRR
jgi:hypothetical protein